MVIRTKPPAEVTIDRSLIRALIQEQHPDLAHLALYDVGEGWDNKLFRLGEALVVRVPRRAVSATLIEHEQRWLPRLSPSLPLSVPAPIRIGRPGCGFPWAWSVVPWFPGQSALGEAPSDPVAAAVALGEFLRALHQPAPADAPRNPWRSVPLAARANILREHLRQVDGSVDRGAVLALWERVLSADPWMGTPLWIHGDLHPGNLLLHGGRLAAVLDFGDLTAGDPATDLSVAWMWLAPPVRPALRASARGELDPIDDDTWMRARGWALALGLAYLATCGGEDPDGALGLSTIDAVLKDDS
jgi:aminoglycoside phosphotransferase (APT) family kinase protein